MQNCYIETENTSCSAVASKQAGATVISFQSSQKVLRKQRFPIVLFTKSVAYFRSVPPCSSHPRVPCMFHFKNCNQALACEWHHVVHCMCSWEGLWTGNHCSKSPWKLQIPSSIVEITSVLFISHIDYTMPEVKTEGSHPARISSPDLPRLKQDEWQERCCGHRNGDFSCLSPMWAVLDYDICIKH